MNPNPRYPGQFDDKSELKSEEDQKYQIINKKVEAQPITEEEEEEESFCPVCNNSMNVKCPMCNKKSRKSNNKLANDEEDDSEDGEELIVCDRKNGFCENDAQIPRKIKSNNQFENIINYNKSDMHTVQLISSPNENTVSIDSEYAVITNPDVKNIILPKINGGDLNSYKFTMARSITIKNFTLSTQIIKSNDSNKLIDGALSAIRLDPGQKRTFLSFGQTWLTV
jgi:hypothetical protein